MFDVGDKVVYPHHGAGTVVSKDVKLVLYYDRVPSLLSLKNILPDSFQRVFRLRRSSQRVVS